MKKEEFPTFLNEQPTIIFGLNARQILIIVCGIVAAYFLWVRMAGLPGAGWFVLEVTLIVLCLISSLIVALIPVASRPLEEWFFAWLLYSAMPKIYLYQPISEEYESIARERETHARQSRASDTIDNPDEE